jgi:hypothetical protein
MKKLLALLAVLILGNCATTDTHWVKRFNDPDKGGIIMYENNFYASKSRKHVIDMAKNWCKGNIRINGEAVFMGDSKLFEFYGTSVESDKIYTLIYFICEQYKQKD